MPKYFLSFLLISFTCSLLPAQNKNVYTKKNFKTPYEEFEYKKDLLRFLDIKSGDFVADVGGAEGYISAALSILVDSVTFYVEDTDPKVLNGKSLNKEVKKYSKLRNGSQTCTFKFSIGSYTSTNLPDGIFDKVLMVASFHEFTQMDEMIADIVRKLKPNGKIYILEAFSLKDKVIHCDAGHKGFTIEETIGIMAKQSFHLTKMKSPESNTVNYANCLAFEKEGANSRMFSDRQKTIEPLIQKTLLLNQPAVASDSLRVNQIADSIKEKISLINDVYIAYECWLKDIGSNHMRKKDYNSAINIYKACIRINPLSPYNYYYLSKAYSATGKSGLAKVQLQKGKSIDPDLKIAKQ